MKTVSLNQYLFLKWMHDTHPSLYSKLVPETGLSGFLDSLGTAFTTLVTEAPKLYGTYMSGKQEIALLKANIERAKAGVAPIDASGQVISTYTPGYGVPQGANVASNFFGSIPPWAWLAGAGVIVLLLIKK